MATEPGRAAAFGAVMEDNGNPIPLPDGSTFTWSTDDPTDIIAPTTQAPDNTAFVQITVSDPPTEGRTSLTATASAVAPDGTTVSGSVTVDIVPGVTHTFTITVSQVQINPLPGGGGGALPSPSPQQRKR